MIEHRDVVRPIRDHNRTSPRFEIEGILFPMLTLSEAEHGVYHDRRVSDALHRHRIFDTTPMSTHPLSPLTSHLSPLTSHLSPLTSST